MSEASFKDAVASILSGEFDESDVKTVKSQMDTLIEKEKVLKRKMEKAKNDFVKGKGKSESELKSIRADIKSIKNMLKHIDI